MIFNPSPLFCCCQYVVGCGTAITLPPVIAVIVPASDMTSVFLWAKAFYSDDILIAMITVSQFSFWVHFLL